jgi:hypothetical protein
MGIGPTPAKEKQPACQSSRQTAAASTNTGHKDFWRHELDPIRYCPARPGKLACPVAFGHHRHRPSWENATPKDADPDYAWITPTRSASEGNGPCFPRLRFGLVFRSLFQTGPGRECSELTEQQQQPTDGRGPEDQPDGRHLLPAE